MISIRFGSAEPHPRRAWNEGLGLSVVCAVVATAALVVRAWSRVRCGRNGPAIRVVAERIPATRRGQTELKPCRRNTRLGARDGKQPEAGKTSRMSSCPSRTRACAGRSEFAIARAKKICRRTNIRKQRACSPHQSPNPSMKRPLHHPQPHPQPHPDPHPQPSASFSPRRRTEVPASQLGALSLAWLARCSTWGRYGAAYESGISCVLPEPFSGQGPASMLNLNDDWILSRCEGAPLDCRIRGSSRLSGNGPGRIPRHRGNESGSHAGGHRGGARGSGPRMLNPSSELAMHRHRWERRQYCFDSFGHWEG